jgi:uncharacterized protein YbjT (DUF2867 family)
MGWTACFPEATSVLARHDPALGRNMARVLLTGATGFVGRHLYPALRAAGHQVISTTRNVEEARKSDPTRKWLYCDTNDPVSVRSALEGCDAAYYLVHSVAASGDYPEREARSAETFRDAAAAAGVSRIVYLGGVAPRRRPSRHLSSRLHCGEILRQGPVPVFELRAAMIIGRGSTSWAMVHDLAQRLPAMVLPRWLRNHSWPVAIDDVVYALVKALELPVSRAGWYDVPGPRRLSHRETLLCVAEHLGKKPVMLSIPLLSPRLSSYWIALVTEVDLALARELVAGLRSDLDPSGTSIWTLLPEHELLTLDDAIDDALVDRGASGVPSRRARRRIERLTAALRGA